MTKITMITMSSNMIFMKNQMSMVTLIIFLSIMLATWMFFLSNIHWFSVLVLLIYVSGVMVLFMFIVSLSPNEKTPMSTNSMVGVIVMISAFFLTKMVVESENVKINSSLEWSLTMMALTVTIIMMMAYLPPKMMKSFYKGMKSSK